MLFGDGAEAVPAKKSGGKGNSEASAPEKKKETPAKKVKGSKDHLYKI